MVKFGTDGLRGVANTELRPELLLALGRAVARVLGVARVAIGRDTRRSGPLLAASLAAGLASEGVDVIDAGVIPTPGLAWLSATEKIPAAMISASHNMFADNGVKVFAAGGTKLATETEAALEAELASIAPGSVSGPVVSGAQVGSIEAYPEALSGYCDHLVKVLNGSRLDSFNIVVDCAHGAATSVAPRVLCSLGAHVTAIAAEPDGTNINDGCGSTHPQHLQEAVVAAGADLGLAFDGDADRMVGVDHTGALVDGDQLLALFAMDLKERDELARNKVVVTVMSNLGFRISMRDRGIDVVDTDVGDRHVLELLEREGLCLGGEQSGHIIFRHIATTGDGILSGLLLIDLLRRKRASLAELAAQSMTRFPQELVNVRVNDPGDLRAAKQVWEEVASVSSDLGEGGRVLLRPSGTEPVVRVMVEAPSSEQAREVAVRLAEVVGRELGS